MRKMILGFAVAIMLMAASAQAQGAVWSATFTPGDINGYAVGCRNGDDDAECSNKDVLSDDTFTVGEIVYTVTEFYQTSGTNRLYFAGIRTPEDGTSWVDIADELKIGSTSLDIGSAFLSQGQNSTSAWRLRWSGDRGLDDVLGGESLTDGTDISVTLISDDLPPPPPPPTTPGAPTGLAATANGPSQIDLAWTAPASTGGSAITGYKIEVSPDGSSWSDLVADTGSPDTAYAHMGLNPATTHHYRVSAINAVGTSVASNSDDDTTTAATNTAAMGAPTITGTAQVGQTLTAATTGITDADGLTSPTYTYQWIRVDGTEADIAAANSSTYILVDADLGTTIKVKVSFTDAANNPETLTSAATATVSAAANTLATGAPTITGTAQVGQTLTAGTTAIMDADGLTSVSYTYQWIGVATDNTETNISSATVSTYTLVAADQGTTVKVTVSFTDDANNPETLTSAATATVSAAANTLATGAPTITGTAQVGQTLTAGTTAIMDADGLTSVSYTYQWIRVATDNTETNISSATASTYMLVAADQGTTITVRVSFTDDANNPETLTSAATATVSAAANTLATGAPTITGTATVGQTLTAGTAAIMDADGLTTPSYTYQWIRVATDNTETNISSATASTYMLVAADQGTTLKVRVSFTDDASNSETLTSAATATVGAGNTAPTGAPTITGTAEVGQTLTASTTGIADADGLTSPTYTYQWIRVDGTEADIAAANSSTYILVATDLGTTLKVRVTFADDLGHTETLTSAATATVTATPATCEAGEELVNGVCVPIPPPPLTCDSDPNADNKLSINERFDTLPRPCAVSVDGKIRAILLSEGGAIAIQSDLDSDVIHSSEMRKGDQTIPGATAVFWCIADAEGRIWHTSETDAATITVECADPSGPVPDPEIQVSVRDTFKYWDSDENADLTCIEAFGGGGIVGLKLPAYSDRDDTGVIYDWLELETASDSDGDGIACESNSNAGGYIPNVERDEREPTPTPTMPEAAVVCLALLMIGAGARQLRRRVA